MSKLEINILSIGVAILSTNRPECTKRLLDSIQKRTPTMGWKVFVMDDSESHIKPKVIDVCQRDWVQYCDTGERIGVAKNTNFAMKAIQNYPYKILLNNDVEILKPNWQFFYPVVAVKKKRKSSIRGNP